ncbi:MAG TPA: S8 family serine peptidase [Thermoanaerobaculia bacterium]|nr:S8 family serine peptidase [Thermoanaerobaculia bacterium]
MPRFAYRLAAVLYLAICAVAQAAGPSLVSTRCREVELPLDGRHSVALLAGCGEGYPDDLLWHLDRVDQIDGQLDGLFDRRGGGVGSVVYVMDTGVLASHAEFGAPGTSRVIAGFDLGSSIAIGSSSCRSSDKALAPCIQNLEELAASSHGTAVASIIAGSNVGVAPAASLVSIRVMNERGLATTRTYLDGLDAIIRHAWSADAPHFRTAIINISGWVVERLSSDDAPGKVVPFAVVERRIRDMIAGVDAGGRVDPDGKRFLFVVAANNLDGGCGLAGIVDRFPATLGSQIDGMITVGGITLGNRWWTGGCRGDAVEVLAPAQSIFSATITGTDHYRGRRPNHRSGTSFASPIIAGIAARLLSDRPDLSPQQLETWITNTPSRIVNPDRVYADGKVGVVQSIETTSHATKR